MRRKVFLTSCNVKAPGISGMENLQYILNDPDFVPPMSEITFNKASSGYFGSLDLDAASPYYPDRQDLKIMRKDIVASVICIGELLEENGMVREDLKHIPLFIANGMVVDKLYDKNNRLARLFFEAIRLESNRGKNIKLFKTVPPLLALQTLTNATESYVAQYSGIAGNNTTFGNTSISAYYALLEGFRNIESGKSNMAIVGASNSSGIYSNYTFRQFTDMTSVWRESPCSVFLLLESAESMKLRQKTGLCEMVELKSSNNIPVLFESSPEKPYGSLIDEINGELTVFSGGFTEADYEKERQEVRSKSKNSFSWYSKLGNLGAGAVLMNIVTAVALMKSSSVALADCLDHDPYLRTSLVRLKVC